MVQRGPRSRGSGSGTAGVHWHDWGRVIEGILAREVLDDRRSTQADILDEEKRTRRVGASHGDCGINFRKNHRLMAMLTVGVARNGDCEINCENPPERYCSYHERG
eukprot:2869232-Rhodomonas_salina.1